MSSSHHQQLQQRQSYEILRSRYHDLLQRTDPILVTQELHAKGMLSDQHLCEIMEFREDTENLLGELCNVLTAQGISNMVAYSAEIRKLTQQQMQVDKAHVTASSGGSEGKQVDHMITSRPTITSHDSQNANKGSNTGQSTSATNGVLGSNSHNWRSEQIEFKSDSIEGERVSALLLEADQNICEKTEGIPSVNDHIKSPWKGYYLDSRDEASPMDPQKSESIPGRRQSTPQMEAFAVLLFTFFSQLQVSLENLASLPSPSRAQQQSIPQGGQSNKNTTGFSWLNFDIERGRSIRDYFPSELLKGVNPSPNHLVKLRMSVLLDAFQQLCQKYMKISPSLGDHSHLHRNDRHQKSEPSKFPQSGKASPPVPTPRTRKPPPSPSEDFKRVSSLERAYLCSEERCKQLVEVTRQWSAECADKDNLIAVQTAQLEQCSDEVHKLERKLTKYKRFWLSCKDGGGFGNETPHQRATDAQFEELRQELAFRRELNDKVVQERDEAEKKVKNLQSEVDELRDLVEELRDRVGNFKLIAQAKEPTVREMSNLLESNRKLKEEVNELRKINSDLSDEVLAFKTYVEDINSQGINPHHLKKQSSPTVVAPPPSNSDQSPVDALPKPKPRQHSKNFQAMVTGGFDIPSHIKQQVRDRDSLQQQLACADPPFAPRRPPQTTMHSDKILTPFALSPPVATDDHMADRNDDDSSTVTTSSSCSSNEDDSLSQHSVHSGWGSYTPIVRGSSGAENDHNGDRPRSAPPSPHNLSLNRQIYNIQDTSGSTQQQHHHNTGSLTPVTHSQPSPSSSTHGGGHSPDRSSNDYTQLVRYPNNSGIIVKPLTNEELSLPQQHDTPPAVSNGDNVPGEVKVLKDPIAQLPADSTLYDFTLSEKQCPFCYHVFMTLTEAEYQSHMAGCATSSSTH